MTDSFISPKTRLGLTHIALRCVDTRKTSAFYRDVCRMKIVHERDGETQPVYWLSARPLGVDFVIVLFAGGDTGPSARWDHLGFTVDNKTAVDEVAKRAEQDGLLVYEPRDSGPPVGYWCMIRDPDGNHVEFSFGQDIRFE